MEEVQSTGAGISAFKAGQGGAPGFGDAAPGGSGSVSTDVKLTPIPVLTSHDTPSMRKFVHISAVYFHGHKQEAVS